MVYSHIRSTWKKRQQNHQKKSSAGRPPKSYKIDSDIVKKITDLLKIDCTIEEAMRGAGKSEKTYYNWINDEVYFLQEIIVDLTDWTQTKKYEQKLFEDAVEEAQKYCFIYARKTLFKAINNGADSNKALEFLKRRDARYRDKIDWTFKWDPDAPLIQVFIPDNQRDIPWQKKKSSK